ncbi:MAG: hypothetical protein NVS4B8_21550 [Herpetosiphon sp.]
MMTVVIIGACGTGKTTLLAGLRSSGYRAQIIAQEHSAIPGLWHHNGMPDAVVYLHATAAVISVRRSNTFPEWLYLEQLERLADGRAHATVVVDTTCLSAAEVRDYVVTALKHSFPQSQEQL